MPDAISKIKIISTRNEYCIKIKGKCIKNQTIKDNKQNKKPNNLISGNSSSLCDRPGEGSFEKSTVVGH